MRGIVKIVNGKKTLMVEDDDEYVDYLFEPGEVTGQATRRRDGKTVEVAVTHWRQEKAHVAVGLAHWSREP